MISILSRNLEAHALTVWKNTWMLMKLKIGWDAHVYAMVSWNVLWKVVFWLINLSDGLILLIFILDLWLDNVFLIFFFLILCSL